MANHTIVASIAPNTVPDHIGQEYYNSVTGIWYKAAGVASSSDWVPLPSKFEEITLSADTSKEFTLDLTTASVLELECFDMVSASGGGPALQVYESGAWKTAGYIYEYLSAAGASASAVPRSENRLLFYGSTGNQVFHGRIYLKPTSFSAVIQWATDGTYTGQSGGTVATSAHPTKMRIMTDSGTLTGTARLTVIR